MSGTSMYLHRGGIALIAIGVGGFAADYLLNIGLTRMLPPHEYGDFRVAREMSILLGALVLLGGDRAGPKALAGPLAHGHLARAWEYVRFYLLIGLTLSGGVIVATWVVSALHVGSFDPMHHHAVAWLVPAVPLYAVGALASRTLQSARRPVLAALPWRVGVPLLLLTMVWALSLRVPAPGLPPVLALTLLSVLAVAGWQWRLMRRLALPVLERDPTHPARRDWLATSVPMMGVFLIALALNQSDLYFLELLGDESEVGLYGAAATTAHFVVLIQTTIVGLVAPLVQPAIAAGPTEARAILRRGQHLMLAGLVPVGLGCGLAAHPVLSMFGSAYVQAELVLRLLLLGNVAWATAALATLWLQYTGRGPIVVGVGVSTLVMDSALNVLLIPRYGMAGAAVSTALTLGLAAVALAVAHRTCRLGHSRGQ